MDYQQIEVAIAVAVPLMSGVFTIIWWLLRQKDEAQQRAIEELQKQNTLLFEKHDKDVAELQALRLQIAEGHYKKSELDDKFRVMDQSIKEGLAALSAKLDKLMEAVMRNERTSS